MNRVFLLALLSCLASCATTTNKNDNQSLGYKGTQKSGLGQESALEVLKSLKSNPNAIIRIENGWTIIQLPTDERKPVWSFPPESHPAYPSSIKRNIVKRDGGLYMNTEVSCGAEKSVCDDLVKAFLKLNQKVRDAVSGK
jgi:hypothetical protein